MPAKCIRHVSTRHIYSPAAFMYFTYSNKPGYLGRVREICVAILPCSRHLFYSTSNSIQPRGIWDCLIQVSISLGTSQTVVPRTFDIYINTLHRDSWILFYTVYDISNIICLSCVSWDFIHSIPYPRGDGYKPSSCFFSWEISKAAPMSY